MNYPEAIRIVDEDRASLERNGYCHCGDSMKNHYLIDHQPVLCEDYPLLLAAEYLRRKCVCSDHLLNEVLRMAQDRPLYQSDYQTLQDITAVLEASKTTPAMQEHTYVGTPGDTQKGAPNTTFQDLVRQGRNFVGHLTRRPHGCASSHRMT